MAVVLTKFSTIMKIKNQLIELQCYYEPQKSLDVGLTILPDLLVIQVRGISVS